jgi:Ca-activated chloride channel family protein
MQFIWPSLLWSLLVVPVILAVYVAIQRKRRRYALRYSSLLVLKQTITPGHRLRRHVPPALFLLGLSAMLFALARPQTSTIVPVDARTVILAIDVSGSMRTRDIEPSRIDAAKAAATSFVKDQKPGTRIGIVAFSGTASIVQPPTSDHDALIAAIQRLYPERSTAIGSGIIQSLNAIYGNIFTDTFGGDIAPTSPSATVTPVPKGAHAPSTIILLTDGANVQGPSPIEAAQKAAELGVRIFTIGVGNPNPNGRPSGGGNSSPSGGNGPYGNAPYGGGGGAYGGGGGTSGGRYYGSRFEVDETTLKNIAETTDGEYFLATDANALNEIYQKLNTEIVFTTQKTEVTSYFTALGAVLLFGASALSILWFNRLP